MLSIGCKEIIDQLSESFIFSCNDQSIVTKSTLRLMNAIISEPSLRHLSSGLLAKLLKLPSNSVENFTKFLIDIYNGFFAEDQMADVNDAKLIESQQANKFSIWSELIDEISLFIRTNNIKLKDLYKCAKHSTVFEVFCQYLYWPLLLTLSKTETQVNIVAILFFYCSYQMITMQKMFFFFF